MHLGVAVQAAPVRELWCVIRGGGDGVVAAGRAAIGFAGMVGTAVAFLA